MVNGEKCPRLLAKDSVRWCMELKLPQPHRIASCAALPGRKPSAWPTCQRSVGSYAPSERLNRTQLERPEATLEPQSLFHLARIHPDSLQRWKSLCSAEGCSVALGEDGGFPRKAPGPRSKWNTRERTASCPPALSPCLCMLGSWIRWAPKSSFYWQVMPMMLRSRAVEMWATSTTHVHKGCYWQLAFPWNETNNRTNVK